MIWLMLGVVAGTVLMGLGVICIMVGFADAWGLILVGIVLAVGGGLLAGASISAGVQQETDACEAKGGTLIDLGRDNACVTEDGRLIR